MTLDTVSTVARGKRTASRGPSVKQILAVIAGWLTIAVVWELLSRLLTATIFPGPIAVAIQMVEIALTGDVLGNFLSSLSKIALGFVIGAAVGIPVGYLMGRYPYWKAFFRDTVTVTGSIPTIAYAVMSLILFGLSPIGPVLVVAIVSAPHIAVNVAEGTEGVDPGLRRMSQAYGRSGRDIRRHVDLPSITPFIFAGVRLSFAVAWKVAALTEVFGGSNGVGFQIKKQYQLFSIDGLLAWMFFFVIFMLILERLLARLERKVLAWRPAQRNEVPR